MKNFIGYPKTKVLLIRNDEFYKLLPKLIIQAKNKIRISTFFMKLTSADSLFSTKRILDILISQKHNNGIDVQVLIDKSHKSEKYSSSIVNKEAYLYLKEQGIDIKNFRNKRRHHSKLVLIDDDIVIIGSHNFTSNSFGFLDEVSVLLRSEELNRFYSKLFLERWAIAE